MHGQRNWAFYYSKVNRKPQIERLFNEEIKESGIFIGNYNPYENTYRKERWSLSEVPSQLNQTSVSLENRYYDLEKYKNWLGNNADSLEKQSYFQNKEIPTLSGMTVS